MKFYGGVIVGHLMTPVANWLTQSQHGLVTLRDCWAYLIANYHQVCGTLYISQDSSTSSRHLYTPQITGLVSCEALCCDSVR